jgi:uncharacterized membrane protein
MTDTPVTPPVFTAPPPSLMRSFMTGLRTWFLTGLVIAGPLAVTASLVFWFIDTVDQWVKPLIPPALWPDTYLPVHVHGTGVILAFFGLTLLGFLAANLAGRTLLRIGENLLDRMPVVRGIYKSMKQIFETVFAQNGTSFRKAALVEFPSPGMWSIVFLSSAPSGPLSGVIPGQNMISVFLPCTPNPTTGFWFYVPADKIIELSISPDEAFKLIMSAGLIQPKTFETKAAELAAPAAPNA